MTTASHIAEQLPALSASDRQLFYTRFAHELTIDFRAVGFDEDLASESIIESLKKINELQHRILGRIMALHQGNDTSPEADFIGMVQARAKNSDIPGEIGRALQTAWRTTVKT